MGERFCNLDQLYKKFSGNDAFPSPKLNEDRKQELGLRRKPKSFFPHIWGRPKKRSPRRVARNSQWGANFGVWGRSPQLPEAGSLGAKPPAAGGTGVLGAEPPTLENFAFFCKNSFILGLF